MRSGRCDTSRSHLSARRSGRANADQFIVEAEFDVSATFEQAMAIATYRAEFGLVYARLRPDLILRLPARAASRSRSSRQGTSRSLAPGDSRLQLRVIDIKLTAEPSPSYFAEVAYYSDALAGWLDDQRPRRPLHRRARWPPSVWVARGGDI